MIGRITYFISEMNSGIIRFNPFFIDPSMHIEQISQELYSRMNYSYAAKSTFHLAGVFYQRNEPILLSEKFDQKQLNDITFYEKNGLIKYRLSHLTESRKSLKNHMDFEKQKQPTVLEALKGFDVDWIGYT